MFRWTLTNLSDLTTEVLTSDPYGWEECLFRIERDAEYMGFLRDFSAPLKFHCNGGGKEFIDAIYEAEDIDGRIEVLVEYKCDPIGNTYDTLYIGVAKLATYKTDGETTSVGIERGGATTKIKSRDELQINLESAESVGGETISVVQDNILNMAGQQIYFRMESELDGIESQSWFESIAISVTYRGYIVPNILTVWQDAEQYGGFTEYNDYAANGPSPSETFYPPVYEAIDLNIKWPATFNYEIEVVGTFYDEVDVGGVGAYSRAYDHKLNLVVGRSRFIGYDPNLQNVVLYNGDYSTLVHQYVDNMNFTASGTITLDYNEALYVRWNREGAVSAGPPGLFTHLLQWDYTTFRFKLEIASEFPASTAKSVLVHEALNQTCDAILDENDTVHSEFYGRMNSDKRTYADNGEGAFKAITNGLNIRAFPDKPIFCSLKDLFQSLNAVDCIGLGVEEDPNDSTRDIVRVEPLTYFYDPSTLVISLPNVADVETTNDNSRYFNSIKIGYLKWETEYRGGLDEPNTNREYSTKVSSLKKTYTRLCKYLASSYAIEFTRRRGYDRFPTSDYRTDNDNFFIVVNRGTDPYSGEPDQLTHPELRADAFDSASGMLPEIDIDKVLNLRLTPARMLQAHLNVLVAGLQKIQDFVKFIRGDGNTAVLTNMTETTTQESYSGADLSESQSFEWNDANVTNIAPLWGTEIYKFEYPISYADFVTIRANPYGYISFTDRDGVEKRGFILSFEFPLEKSAKAKFELLKLPV